MKQHNARVQKWRQMLNGDILQDHIIFKKRIRKGIPCSIRCLVWPKIINLQKYKKQQNKQYSDIIKQDTLYEEDICKDIQRTFQTEYPIPMYTSLFNVLKAISISFMQLGYCQGMNFLVMRLLEIMDDETAFWIIHYFLTTYQNIYWIFRSPQLMELQNGIISQLSRKNIPQIYNKLKQQNIQPLLYTQPWLLTFFSVPLPSEIFYRIFQCFLFEGQKIIYRAALTMLSFKQTVILSGCGLEHITNNSIYQGYHPDQFITTMFNFKIKRIQISNMQKIYFDLNKQSITQRKNNANQISNERIKEGKHKHVHFQEFDLDLSIFQSLSCKLIDLI